MATPALAAFRTDDRNVARLLQVEREPKTDELRTTARSRSSSYQESCRAFEGGVGFASGGASRYAASGGVAFGSEGEGRENVGSPSRLLDVSTSTIVPP